MPAPMASPAPELVLNAEHYSRVLRDILPTTKEFLEYTAPPAAAPLLTEDFAEHVKRIMEATGAG